MFFSKSTPANVSLKLNDIDNVKDQEIDQENGKDPFKKFIDIAREIK